MRESWYSTFTTDFDGHRQMARQCRMCVVTSWPHDPDPDLHDNGHEEDCPVAEVARVTAERDALAVENARLREAIVRLSENVGEPVPTGFVSVPSWLLADVIRTLRADVPAGVEVTEDVSFRVS